MNSIAYCLSSASSPEFYGDAFDYEVEYASSESTCHATSAPHRESVFLDSGYMMSVTVMDHWSWTTSDAAVESPSVYSERQSCDSEFPRARGLSRRFEISSPFQGISLVYLFSILAKRQSIAGANVEENGFQPLPPAVSGTPSLSTPPPYNEIGTPPMLHDHHDYAVSLAWRNAVLCSIEDEFRSLFPIDEIRPLDQIIERIVVYPVMHFLLLLRFEMTTN